jgi:NAD(P)H-hydrate epimerase
MAQKLVTVAQMREIDRITIQERGVPALELMERAGRAVADAVVHRFQPRRVGIVTGKGNNAGDGLVVARALSERGIAVRLVMLVQGADLSEAARHNFQRLPENVERFDRPSGSGIESWLRDCDVVVDAILGTGASGPVRGPFGEAIAAVNGLGKPVAAIDVPSGLNADTGRVEGAGIIAQLTVTIGLPKIGMIVGAGKPFAGEVIVADIGFPEDLTHDPDLKLHLLELQDVWNSLPNRPFDGHKGTFGSVLVVAGRLGMDGAAYLTTAAALRSGCGMVYAAFPHKVMRLVAASLVEAVKIPHLGDAGEFLTHHFWDALRPFVERVDVIALGPGIGTHPETARLVDDLIGQEVPMVIDADGLNCLVDKVSRLTERKAALVLTPHPGEMGRLVGKSAEHVQANRVETAAQLARGANAVVLLKGAQTVIAEPEGRCFVNPTGNSGMAKGGMGDVLTGLIGGLIAQGCSASNAACVGAYVHGLAGDLAREDLGERGMTARDVLQRIPQALDARGKKKEREKAVNAQ